MAGWDAGPQVPKFFTSDDSEYFGFGAGTVNAYFCEQVKEELRYELLQQTSELQHCLRKGFRELHRHLDLVLLHLHEVKRKLQDTEAAPDCSEAFRVLQGNLDDIRAALDKALVERRGRRKKDAGAAAEQANVSNSNDTDCRQSDAARNLGDAFAAADADLSAARSSSLRVGAQQLAASEAKSESGVPSPPAIDRAMLQDSRLEIPDISPVLAPTEVTSTSLGSNAEGIELEAITAESQQLKQSGVVESTLEPTASSTAGCNAASENPDQNQEDSAAVPAMLAHNSEPPEQAEAWHSPCHSPTDLHANAWEDEAAASASASAPEVDGLEQLTGCCYYYGSVLSALRDAESEEGRSAEQTSE